MAVPQLVKHRISVLPATPLLGIHPKELKIDIQTITYKGLYTAALSLINKGWKQSKCPSIDGWLNTSGISLQRNS